MHRHHPRVFIPLVLCLLAWNGAQVRGEPPRPECAHPAAHVSTFSPSCGTLTCDLLIDPTGTIVAPFAGVRIGDPLSTAGPEEPRFFFDEAGNRFHTELFSQFLNNGGEAVPSGEVTVHFSVKPDATGPTDTSGSFTPIGSYVMDIPGADPLDRLFPNTFHIQPLARPVCWVLGAGAHFPKQFMLKVDLEWDHDGGGTDDETAASDTLYQFYDFTAEALPTDIAFALDLSGSMSTLLPEGVSRLAMAQDRARLFIDLIEDGVGNRFGAFAFATSMPATLASDFTGSWKSSATASHSATLSDTAKLFAFRTMATAADRLAGRLAISDPTTVKPYGCTPIGQGLLRAKKEILDLAVAPGEERGRAIVLFSDGFQNIAPYVNAVPPWPCGGVSTLDLINAQETFKNNTPALPIYSVFFGPEGGWAHQLMVDIQQHTGGDYIYYTGTDLELAAAYYQIRHLVAANALILLVEKEAISGNTPGEIFTVDFDSAAETATVGLAWPVGPRQAWLTVEARQLRDVGPDNWRDLGSPAAINRFEQLPADAWRVFRFHPGPNTTWELRVRRLDVEEVVAEEVVDEVETVPYTLGVFARTEQVRLKASLGAETFAAGKPLTVYADLRAAGHPVLAATVVADVLAPTRSFSTTLRQYSNLLKMDPNAGDQTVPQLAAQLQQLLAEKTGSSELYPVGLRQVTLNDRGQGADEHSGDGIYTGELAGTETRIAGNYTVTVTATGTHSGAAFERTEKLGAVAAIGPIDPAATVVRFSPPRQLDGGYRAVEVTVLATDVYGNATFPGAAPRLGLVAQPGGGTLTGSLVDGLDSGYRQTLVLAPGEEPKVRLRIDGEDLGTYQPGQKPGDFQRFEASFHLGLAVPHGTFGQRHDPGPAWAFDGTWRFSPHFAVRSELGFSLFDEPGGGDRLLVHFVPYLQMRNPVPTWQPYFEAGPGLYQLESAGIAGGFSAGIGVARQLAPHWRLDLALHAHHASGGLDLTCSQIKIGLLFTY